MNNWEIKKLGEIENCDLIMGQSPLSESYNSIKDGLPFLQGKAEFQYIYPEPVKYTTDPIKIAEENDILISVRAPVGDVNIAPYKLCIGRGLAAIRFKQDISKFYYYWFQSKKNFIDNLGTGSTFKAITIDQIKKLDLPVPPIGEQKVIAEILSTVDDAIQKSEKVISRTERLKRERMNRLLTQGIGHKNFKETKIGKIPSDWMVIDIKDLGEVVTGKTPSTFKKDYWTGQIPFITPGDIDDNKYVKRTERKISKEAAEVTSRILPADTILVVCIGSTIGKIGLTTDDCISNQQINSVIIDKTKFNTHFIYYLFSKISKKIKSFSGTAAVPIINKSLFERIKIAMPQLNEQKEIANILSDLDSKIELEKERKQKFINIKKSLMNDLLTGKKRVNLN